MALTVTDLSDQAYWHLILGTTKDESRQNLVELCDRLRGLFRDVYGEDLIEPDGGILRRTAEFLLDESDRYHSMAARTTAHERQHLHERADAIQVMGQRIGQMWLAHAERLEPVHADAV